MLSLKQVQDVCLAYSGDNDRCRYLAQDNIDRRKWYCLKQTVKKTEIDDDVNEFLRELKNKNLDPNKQGVPLGNNCQGYPLLKNIEQGYDK